jgi:hypothetical protein
MSRCLPRVGQNHIYTVYKQCFWQGNHQIDGHIQCVYSVLTNPVLVSIVNCSLHLHVDDVTPAR